jgi:Cu/Ag efflux protein CusF
MKRWAFIATLAAAAVAQAGAHEWVRAKVIKVEPGRSLILLDHERIVTIDMEAMTMPFKAERESRIERFKPGDMVRFTFLNKDDHLVVQKIELVK